MNLQKPILVCALVLISLVAGCETTDPPSVVVMPDSRLTPAMRLVDDSDDAMPRIVEVKVPVLLPSASTNRHGRCDEDASDGRRGHRVRKSGGDDAAEHG